eukprot:11606723-Ditylum_brightwellii.AAC.1
MIARDQKADWDETHPKAQIRSGLEYKTKFARDENGRLCDEGGTYADAPICLDPKYEKDSCFLLGVATVPDATAPEGVVGWYLLLFVYTGKNDVSHATWEEEAEMEINCTKKRQQCMVGTAGGWRCFI